VYNRAIMPMTDTDRLATPADLMDVLRRLTLIMRNVEALPATAQQHFWDDLQMPVEDLRIDADVSLRTVTVFYNLLVTMCGPRLTELVNGDAKEYYESIISQMKEATHREWDAFLDQKFEETKGTDHEGSVFASVTIHTAKNLGRGLLRRIDGDPRLLKLTDAEGRERYFASKDIVMMEFESAAVSTMSGA
jgi:hypothetical protein